MKINFEYIESMSQSELEEHASYLANIQPIPGIVKGKVTGNAPPEGYEGFHCVDVLGPEFVWMNETFTQDKYTWYLWFESVFLVPDEMATFLALRWS